MRARCKLLILSSLMVILAACGEMNGNGDGEEIESPSNGATENGTINGNDNESEIEDENGVENDVNEEANENGNDDPNENGGIEGDPYEGHVKDFLPL